MQRIKATHEREIGRWHSTWRVVDRGARQAEHAGLLRQRQLVRGMIIAWRSDREAVELRSAQRPIMCGSIVGRWTCDFGLTDDRYCQPK